MSGNVFGTGRTCVCTSVFFSSRTNERDKITEVISEETILKIKQIRRSISGRIWS